MKFTIIQILTYGSITCTLFYALIYYSTIYGVNLVVTMEFIYWLIIGICDYIAKIIEESAPNPGYLTWRMNHWLRYFINPPVNNMITDAFMGIFVIPLIEELLFFALPIYVLGTYVVPLCIVAFGFAHICPILDACRITRLPKRYVMRLLIANVISYCCGATAPVLLWVNGLGVLSILNHMLVNARNELGTVKKLLSLEGRKDEKKGVFTQGFI